MKNVFDITDFGAAENIECTKAIQAAVDAAAQVKGAVIIPPGKYLCGNIRLKPSVSLIGSHGWGYRETGGSTLVLSDRNVKCMIDMTDAFGACVKGIQFNGNGLKGSNIHGIMLDRKIYNGGRFAEDEKDENPLLEPTHAEFREDNFVIADCQIKNFSGDGIHLNKIFAFTVCDCQIMSNGGDGIYVNGWDGWIHDCIIHTNNGAGIGSARENSICASITVTGNRIEWNKSGGVRIINGDSLTVNNNFFDRCGGAAVSLKADSRGAVKDITVVGNIFRRSGKPNFGGFNDKYDSSHVYLKHCENVVVSSNVYRLGVDDGGSGAASPDYSIVGIGVKNCVITNNAMSGGFIKEPIVTDETCENNIIKDNIH